MTTRVTLIRITFDWTAALRAFVTFAILSVTGCFEIFLKTPLRLVLVAGFEPPVYGGCVYGSDVLFCLRKIVRRGSKLE